jgi:hypothetical protein
MPPLVVVRQLVLVEGAPSVEHVRDEGVFDPDRELKAVVRERPETRAI